MIKKHRFISLFGHHCISFEMTVLRVSGFRFEVSVKSYLLHLKVSEHIRVVSVQLST